MSNTPNETPSTPGELIAMQILAIPNEFPSVPTDAVENVMELLAQGGTTPEEYRQIALAILELLIDYHKKTCGDIVHTGLNTELDKLLFASWIADSTILQQAAAMIDSISIPMDDA